MRTKRKLWLLPLLVGGIVLAGTSVASRINVDAAPDSPLKVWLRDDSGRRWDDASLFWGELFSSWDADAPLESQVVTIVVENTGPVAIDDVHVTMDSVPGCTRTIGSVAPGPNRRKAFSCSVEPDNSAFVAWQDPPRGLNLGGIIVHDDVTRPAGAPGRSGEGFAVKIKVQGVVDGEPVRTAIGCPESSSGSDCRSIVRNVVEHPDLLMELGPVSGSDAQQSVTISVTNPAPYERFVGALDGSVGYSTYGWIGDAYWNDDLSAVWWELPEIWRQTDAMTCGSLPGTIPPGGTATATCTWSSPPGAPRNMASVTLNSKPFPNPWPIGGATATVPVASATATLPRPADQLAIDVTSAVVVGAGEEPTVTVTVSNTGPGSVDDIEVMTPTAFPSGWFASATTPVLTGCASSIGTLAGGASHAYTCGGKDWVGDPIYFIATGTIRGQGPVAAQDHVKLFDNRAGNSTSFDAEIVPFTQDVTSGGAAEFMLLVRLPGGDPGSGRTLQVFDPDQPSCDASPFLYGGGAAEVVRVSCRIESSSGTFDWTPTVALEERELDPATGQYTRRVSVIERDISLDRRDVDRDLTVQVTPRSGRMVSGSSMQLDVRVTNRSDVDAYLTHASATLVDPTAAESGYSNVASSPNCERDLGTLISGATVTYSCEISSDFYSYRMDPKTVRTLVGVTADRCGGDGCPSYAGAAADVVIDGTDNLQVQLVGPAESVGHGELTEFRVRVTNAGGVVYQGLTVWSPDLPSCDREMDLGERFQSPELLVPGDLGTYVEFTCTAIAGEQFDNGEVIIKAVGDGSAGDGWHYSAAAVGLSRVVVVESPTTPTTTPATPTTTPATPTIPPAPTTSVPVPVTSNPNRPSPERPVIPSSPPPPRSGESVVPTPRSGDASDPGPASPRDTGSDSPQLGESEPVSDPPPEVEGRTEVALSAPDGAPPEVVAPDSQQFEPVVGVKRVRARGVVNSSQPATSLSLVLLLAMVAMLVVRPLVSRSGRSRVSAVPTGHVGPPSTSEELV